VKVLGIDPSTKTGWCCLSGTKGNSIALKGRGEIYYHKARGIERVQLIGQAIANLLDAYLPDIVVIENYGFANKHTLVTLVEIGTNIRLVTQNLGYSWGTAAPNAVKKFGTKVGNAKKDKMMIEVYKMWGFEGTDNEVDAYVLAALGLYAGVPGLKPVVTGARRDAMGDWRTANIRIFD